MDKLPRNLGIIGYGDFTKVLIEHLSPYLNIVVSSRSRTEGSAGFGAKFGTVEEVLAKDIIIPSIPSQFIESFFEQNKHSVNPHAFFGSSALPLPLLYYPPLPTCKPFLPTFRSIYPKLKVFHTFVENTSVE